MLPAILFCYRILFLGKLISPCMRGGTALCMHQRHPVPPFSDHDGKAVLPILQYRIESPFLLAAQPIRLPLHKATAAREIN